MKPDPTQSSGYSIQQFSHNGVPNIIPPDRIDAMAQGFFKDYWDQPNYSNPALPQFNAQNSQPLTDTSNTYEIKVDENLSTKDTLSGRFTHFHTTDTNPITKLLSTQVNRPRVNMGGDYIHQFTQALVLDFKFGYSRTPYIVSTVFSNGSGGTRRPFDRLPRNIADCVNGGSKPVGQHCGHCSFALRQRRRTGDA